MEGDEAVASNERAGGDLCFKAVHSSVIFSIGEYELEAPPRFTALYSGVVC